MRRPKSLFPVLLLASALAARGAVDPSTNKLYNPDFELGNLNGWFKDGAGLAAAESCCGQHKTFFYPSAHYDNYLCSLSPLCGNAHDTWDAFIQPQGQYVALAQGVSGLPGSKSFRLSTWISSNGMTGYLRWYAASGGTRSCSSTTVGFPNFALLACVFTTPANTAGFNAHLAGSASAGLWTVSDDWALTQQVTPPVLSGARWPLPIRYWARDYGNSVDSSAAAWNSAVGKTLFVKAANEAAAQVVIDGVDWGDDLNFGFTWPPSGGKQLVEVNIWYLSQWDSPAKLSTITHELGHVLGLAHVEGCQLMQTFSPKRYSYCGVYAPTPADVKGVQAIYP